MTIPKKPAPSKGISGGQGGFAKIPGIDSSAFNKISTLLDLHRNTGELQPKQWTTLKTFVKDSGYDVPETGKEAIAIVKDILGGKKVGGVKIPQPASFSRMQAPGTVVLKKAPLPTLNKTSIQKTAQERRLTDEALYNQAKNGIHRKVLPKPKDKLTK